jgi:tetratricopeptide (TPR) repeat protein
MANLHSTQRDYKTSNFYLKISHFLNDKFLSNEVLLAENYFYQKKIQPTKDLYKSIKSIGPIYSWYVSRSLPSILINEKDLEAIVKNLEDDFLKLRKKNYEHYYELANFYKDNEYFKKSIDNYLIALENINNEHPWYAKILYRIGTSFEKLDDWENAEKYLIKSLDVMPDQPHVLNYLAYTWIDKGINLDEGLTMLKKAVEMKENDGYIIDSLAWAYYAKENYTKAQFFLQIALELVPYDPIINDHYADTLWMLNKNIQARYIWNYILNLDDVTKELKDNINKKLIHGISKKL